MTTRRIGWLSQAIVSTLSDDLLKPEYRKKRKRHPLGGHCYVASEALFHLMGGMESPYRPKVVRHEGGTHWYLEHRTTGKRHDLTAEQFTSPVPYENGKWCGFLTGNPCKRTRILLERLPKENVNDFR